MVVRSSRCDRFRDDALLLEVIADRLASYRSVKRKDLDSFALVTVQTSGDDHVRLLGRALPGSAEISVVQPAAEW